MNSDFFSSNQLIHQINIDIMPLATYDSKIHLLAGKTVPIALESARENKMQYSQPYTDIESINYGKITFGSTERRHFHVNEQIYSFYAGVKHINFNLAKGQPQKVLNEAIAKAITKANIEYDKSLLLGRDGNIGILSKQNHSVLSSTVIKTIDDLIKVLSNMKKKLGANNYASNSFKVLLPFELGILIESSLSYTISGTERIYTVIGVEGVDFNYIPGFVSESNQIIMSYSPQVNWLYTYIPQVLGQGIKEVGLMDEYITTEIGFGTTAIQSTNKDKAILVQPYTTE